MNVINLSNLILTLDSYYLFQQFNINFVMFNCVVSSVVAKDN
jgi:hypothetical protein